MNNILISIKVQLMAIRLVFITSIMPDVTVNTNKYKLYIFLPVTRKSWLRFDLMECSVLI